MMIGMKVGRKLEGILTHSSLEELGGYRITTLRLRNYVKYRNVL